MAGKNVVTAWVLLALPVVTVSSLFEVIPLLQDSRASDEWWYWGGLCLAILVGIGLYRRARVVRDHEWHRSRTVRKMGRTYAAEDSGSWSRGEVLELGPLGQAELQRMQEQRVGGAILRSGQEGVEIRAEAQVHMLSEASHVAGATRGIEGAVIADEGVCAESTIGSLNRPPVDRFIDRLVQATSGMRERAAQRREVRINQLAAATLAGQAQPVAVSDALPMSGGMAAAPSAPPPVRLGQGPSTCVSCGTPNEALARFCASCGSPL